MTEEEREEERERGARSMLLQHPIIPQGSGHIHVLLHNESNKYSVHLHYILYTASFSVSYSHCTVIFAELFKVSPPTAYVAIHTYTPAASRWMSFISRDL